MLKLWYEFVIMLGSIDIWAVVAFLLLLAAALAQANRDADGLPLLSLKRLWAARWAICVIAGGTIYFADQWSKAVGFAPPWPDAIRCEFKEAGTDNPDDMIFYFQGITTQRQTVGAVAVYFLTGGARFHDKGVYEGDWYYFPGEIWFRVPQQTLVDPNNYKMDQLDLPGREYKLAYPMGLDCGGDTIAKIKAAGRAFNFAGRP